MSRSFTYDAENRKETATIGTQTTNYVYDGEGRRVQKVAPGKDCQMNSVTVTTTYLYDVTGQLAAEYVSGGCSTDPGRTYLTADMLGSTRLVTDATGAAIKAYDYLPFGEAIQAGTGGRTTAMGFEASPDKLSIKFTGQLRDAETGLDFFGARYMSSAQGRFTSPDEPFADQFEGNPQSWNLYSYGRNNPLRFADPTGQKCVDTSNGQADDGTGGGCAAAGVDSNGNIQAQQVNVNAQRGNALVAFGINAGFALSNVANDYFSWMFAQRPDVLQNTPTNREFTGQAATLTVGIATAVIGPGGGAAAAPREIKVTWKGLLHVIQGHTGGMAGKSFFGGL